MKHSGGHVLRSVGLTAAARNLMRHRAVVLTYHGVLAAGGEEYEFLNHNFVHAQVFDRQMRWVREHYRPLPLSELVSCYRAGKEPPPRSVAVTFDDGFANNYSVAFPILKRHGIPFTVFVSTGLLDHPGTLLWSERVKRSIYLSKCTSATVDLAGRPFGLDLRSRDARATTAREVLLELKNHPIAVRDAAVDRIEERCGRPALTDADRERYAFLTWDQVRTMDAAGVEFGSHTVSHPILSKLDDDSLESELVLSKRRIELELGHSCTAFAYPNGSRADFGEREKRALERADYHAAFALSGQINRRVPDLFALDRINIGRQLDAATFEVAVAGLLGLARRTRDRLRAVTRRRPARLRAVEAS